MTLCPACKSPGVTLTVRSDAQGAWSEGRCWSKTCKHHKEKWTGGLPGKERK